MKKANTKKLAAASVLCALCVLILLIGSVIEVADLSAAAIASFAILFAVYELRGIYPMLMWICVSILGMLLLPSKLPALYFALFFGWYPILKRNLERLPRAASWILKLVCFVLSFALIWTLSALFLPSEESMPLSVLLCIAGTAVFVIFDIALSRICAIYHRVWKRRFNIHF